MQSFDDAPPTTPPSAAQESSGNKDRLTGEIVGFLAQLRAEHGVDGMALACAAHHAINLHLKNHDDLQTWAMFNQRLARQTTETNDVIHEILRKDARDNGRMN